MIRLPSAQPRHHATYNHHATILEKNRVVHKLIVLNYYHNLSGLTFLPGTTPPSLAILEICDSKVSKTLFDRVQTLSFYSPSQSHCGLIMAPALTYCAIAASFLAMSVRGGLETDPKVFGARSYNYIIVGGTNQE